jgi:hypothetical protein
MHRLVVAKTFRYRDHKRERRELPPGEYLVPDQISLAAAKQCAEQGLGKLHEIVMPACPPPAVRPQPLNNERSEQAVAHKPRRRRGRRKGPAPENKIVHAAENKQTLV